MTEQVLSIQELSDQTGLPRRTIHFYIQQDIIPAPSGAGLGAFYQKEHLIRLKLIPVLRQQGLRLDDIREKFNRHTLLELENLLTAAEELNQKNLQNSAPAPIQPKTVAMQPVLSYSLSQGVMVLVPAQKSADVIRQIENLCERMEHELRKIYDA